MKLQCSMWFDFVISVGFSSVVIDLYSMQQRWSSRLLSVVSYLATLILLREPGAKVYKPWNNFRSIFTWASVSTLPCTETTYIFLIVSRAVDKGINCHIQSAPLKCMASGPMLRYAISRPMHYDGVRVMTCFLVQWTIWTFYNALYLRNKPPSN